MQKGGTMTAGVMAVLWGRHCRQPTRHDGAGDGPLARVVHSEAPAELCADGEHVAVPMDVNPELEAIVRRDDPDRLLDTPGTVR
jgi:hypothetical protein